MKKPTLFMLITIAILHVFTSWGVSIYCEVLGNEVSAPIASETGEEEGMPPEEVNQESGETDFMKYAPYLSVALSLPFDPLFRPFYGTLIPRSFLSQDIGIEIFTKSVSLYDGIVLIANAIFFSAFVSFLWTSLWKLIHRTD